MSPKSLMTIAFIVRSRLKRSSSKVTDGEKSHTKSVCLFPFSSRFELVRTFLGVWMKKYWKCVSDFYEVCFKHFVDRAAYNHKVSLFRFESKKSVSNRSAH